MKGIKALDGTRNPDYILKDTFCYYQKTAYISNKCSCKANLIVLHVQNYVRLKCENFNEQNESYHNLEIDSDSDSWVVDNFLKEFNNYKCTVYLV